MTEPPERGERRPRWTPPSGKLHELFQHAFAINDAREVAEDSRDYEAGDFAEAIGHDIGEVKISLEETRENRAIDSVAEIIRDEKGDARRAAARIVAFFGDRPLPTPARQSINKGAPLPDLDAIATLIERAADRRAGTPALHQVLVCHAAWDFLLQRPYMKGLTIEGVATLLGITGPLFHRKVHRLASVLGMPLPRQKSDEHRRAMVNAHLKEHRPKLYVISTACKNAQQGALPP